MLIQKLRLRIERLLRLRQVEVVPEGVRQRVEDHQPGVHAGAQERPSSAPKVPALIPQQQPQTLNHGSALPGVDRPPAAENR